MLRLIVISIFLTGCSLAAYKPPATKEVAYVTIPDSEFTYKLLGGFSSLNVHVGELDENGCIGIMNSRKVKDSSKNPDGTISIPANKDVRIHAFLQKGNYGCAIGGAANLESGKNYELTLKSYGALCILGFTEKLNDGSHKKIELSTLKDKVSKLCKT